MKKRYLLEGLVSAAVLTTFNYAQAEDISKTIFITDAWVQAMPPSQKNTAAYMTITNNSFKEAVINSVSSDVAATTEIHQMGQMNGMMTNVRIAALSKLLLNSGGVHIMLVNLKKPLHKGDIVPITLNFQDGGSIVVKAEVKSSDDPANVLRTQ